VRTVFHPFLPNGPSGDPALWVDVPDEGHSLLLDLGDLRRIPHRKLLRVDRVVVTHTHMDHFIGFDHLLRLALGRTRELVVTGPAGFLRHVQGKIDAYVWKLIESYPVRLRAEELDGESVRAVLYTGVGGMRPEPLPSRRFTGAIHAERAYTMRVEIFDHGVPVLGVALCETEHLSVNKDRLIRMGLQPGPWLRELKQAMRRRLSEEEPIEAVTEEGGARIFPRGELAEQILFRTPGQKIGYLSDLRHTPANLQRALGLAHDADLLVCEAAFLHEDEPLARERYHLTARQAGELARAAGAKKLAPFHFSPRYQGRERELFDEAGNAFGGPIVELPPGPIWPDVGVESWPNTRQESD
jgi:ribonuclease Z